MNSLNIIAACELVLKSAVDNVITLYWFDIEDDALIIKYLPLPSYSNKDLQKRKKIIDFIFLSAEDNDVFKACKLRHLHACIA